MRSIVILFLVAAGLSSCRSQQVTAIQAPDDHQDHLLMAAAFVQHAAEYRALCFQAYNAATFQLTTAENLSVDKRAIVLDLDETVLDNSPYTGWQIQQRQTYSGATWQQWTALAAADTIPGAGRFLHAADKLGYAIFYVSNRKVADLDATLLNMKKFGLPQAEATHVLLRTDTSNKIPRREQIQQQGYQIVMLVGDNACDLDGQYEEASQQERERITDSLQQSFGRRLIVLPNPVYGSWEGALMEGYTGSSLSQKRTHLRSLLNVFRAE